MVTLFFVSLHHTYVLQPNEGEYWVSGRSEEEALEKASKKFQVSKEKIKVKQGN